MWMVPPDINNQVIVMFINGDSSRGIWIGSLYDQFMNNMVPAMAASADNYQYDGKIIPVAEYNKWDTSIQPGGVNTAPYEKTKFQGLGNQGLITDQGRGITTSSARRESPSNVFGIITPGPVIDATASKSNIRRKGGSSFIMDDGTGTEYVQLATKSGAQIRIDETNGFVYLINRDGTAWVQMDQKGNIDIFGATNISMRAQQDINLRADRNINIEAGQNIFLKAAKDTKTSTTTFTYDVNNVPKPSTIPYYQYVGEGAGEGGNIVTQALNNTHTTVKNNSYITIGNNLELKVTGTIDIDAGAEYNLTAPSIRNVGAVKIRGTLDVTGAVDLGSSLGVVDAINGGSLSLSGGITAGVIVGNFPGLRSGPGAVTGGPGTAGPAVNIPTPPSVTPAEVKPLVEKINILATWADSESKFKRNAESLQTTVSTLTTYEPCPEHEQFRFSSITGYTPKETEASKTYEGSGGAGNDAVTSPVTNADPGANNTEIQQPQATESAVSKDLNMKAYECQLKIHEGVKYVSYIDSVGLPTAGIGHLLRTNEISSYPVPTPVAESRVTTWFQQDAPISIAGAHRLLGTDVWAELTDIRKRACADLCYNMGEPRLAKFKKFLAAMRASDYNSAGISLRNTKWFTQVGRRGPNIISMIVNNVDPNGCDKKFPT
jgi:lysozyme